MIGQTVTRSEEFPRELAPETRYDRARLAALERLKELSERKTVSVQEIHAMLRLIPHTSLSQLYFKDDS